MFQRPVSGDFLLKIGVDGLAVIKLHPFLRAVYVVKRSDFDHRYEILLVVNIHRAL